jgi:hypothetical protein
MVDRAAAQGWDSNRAMFSAATAASRCRQGRPEVPVRGIRA